MQGSPATGTHFCHSEILTGQPKAARRVEARAGWSKRRQFIPGWGGGAKRWGPLFFFDFLVATPSKFLCNTNADRKEVFVRNRRTTTPKLHISDTTGSEHLIQFSCSVQSFKIFSVFPGRADYAPCVAQSQVLIASILPHCNSICSG